MNREMILRVADAIEAAVNNPSSLPGELQSLGFNLGMPIGPTYSEVRDNTGHQCGTVACIAGWAIAIERSDAGESDVLRSSPDWQFEGRRLLGLDIEVSSDLFHGHSTDVAMEDITPFQAVAALRNLVETGELNWSVAIAKAEGRS